MEPLVASAHGDDTAKSGNFIVGGGSLQTAPGGPGAGNAELSDLVSVVSKKLAQNGCRVATLKGMHIIICIFSSFHASSRWQIASNLHFN